MHAAPQALRLVTHAPVRVDVKHLSPRMSADDARWVLAMRVRESLQGGSAAILPPEARSRISDIGRRLGLRPFDVSLIIAIVQDEARVGAGRMNADVAARLAMVPGAGDRAGDEPAQSGLWWMAWAGATVAIGAGLAVLGVLWVTG